MAQGDYVAEVLIYIDTDGVKRPRIKVTSRQGMFIGHARDIAGLERLLARWRATLADVEIRAVES